MEIHQTIEALNFDPSITRLYLFRIYLKISEFTLASICLGEIFSSHGGGLKNASKIHTLPVFLFEHPITVKEASNNYKLTKNASEIQSNLKNIPQP